MTNTKPWERWFGLMVFGFGALVVALHAWLTHEDENSNY